MKPVLILFLMFVTTAALGQPDRSNMDHPRRTGERLMERLKLTPDQEKQFSKLRTDMMKKQVDLRANIQKDRIDLGSLMHADNPSKGSIESKQKDINNLQGEIKLNRTEFWFAVNSILTPDQQKEWKQLPEFLMHRGRRQEGRLQRGMMMWRQRGSSLGSDQSQYDDPDSDLFPPLDDQPDIPPGE